MSSPTLLSLIGITAKMQKSEGSLPDKEGVPYNKKRLLAHQDRHIRMLAKKLP
jgi:hypothetical protein